MLEGWKNETVLHENTCRSYFRVERKCIVFALQHGGNDVTWKCSIPDSLKTGEIWYWCEHDVSRPKWHEMKPDWCVNKYESILHFTRILPKILSPWIHSVLPRFYPKIFNPKIFNPLSPWIHSSFYQDFTQHLTQHFTKILPRILPRSCWDPKRSRLRSQSLRILVKISGIEDLVNSC